MQRLTLINRLAGKMPGQSDAEDKLRFQSTNELPIVRCKDLSRRAGEEVSFDLVQPIGGKPIMGEAYAEGNGDRMDFANDSLRINQYRKPISAGGKMTQQRTETQMRTLARAQALNYMQRLEDQACLVHLAGARGSDNNIEWAIPLASDPDFSSIMINPVRAPTRNRHFLASSGSLKKVVAAGNEITIASTDVMNSDVLDAIRTKLDSMPLPPRASNSRATLRQTILRCACCWCRPSSTRRLFRAPTSAPCRPTRWRALRWPRITRSSSAKQVCGTVS
jgi:hypothetical protein